MFVVGNCNILLDIFTVNYYLNYFLYLATHFLLDNILLENPQVNKHVLDKQQKRSKCSKCYRTISKEKGRKEAQRLTKQVFTKCTECNLYFCSECFFPHTK